MSLGLTALELARIQFAFTVSFHIIFPATSIGLACFLAMLEWKWLRTQNPIYKDLFKYWIKIFAVAFAMGVVSGIVMAYQFGTNWSEFSRIAGSVTGPLLTYEVMSAFFLEAGFLGIMLFGWGRVSPKAHFFATLMVAIGTCISMFWILSSNSWMQTPQGFSVENGIIIPTDWWAIVFNPSFPYRFAHMAVAAFLVSSLLVVGTAAWHLIKGRRDELIKKSFSMGLWMVLATSCLQVVIGDHHGLNTLKHQPAKLAALEGHYDENAAADMYLLGWVDQESQEVTGLAIPGGLSFLLDQDFEAPVTGLNAFPEDERPSQVNAVFQFYHLMVAIGMFLIALTLYASFLMWKKKLFTKKWLLWVFVFTALLPQIANQVGWFSAEMGRQPWVVYGLLRTNEAFSQAVTANQVLFSLILFFAVYALLFLLFVYLLNKKIKHGPYEEANDEDDDRPLTKEISEVVTG
mgnify:CR=1 FL=1